MMASLVEAAPAAAARDALPAPLLDAAAAQRAPVARLPAFLSAAEVADIHAFRDHVAGQCGTTAKQKDALTGAETWSTTYLSTDALFQRRFPLLIERMLRAARAASFGGIATGVELNVRVVEYHVVARGGELRRAAARKAAPPARVAAATPPPLPGRAS